MSSGSISTRRAAPLVRDAASGRWWIRSARLLDGDSRRLVDGEALLEAGRIAGIGPPGGLGTPPAGERVVDARGALLLPGWIDIQVNDMEWLATGLRTPVEHAARVREVAAAQAARGVTGLCLATLAAPLEEILAYLEGMQLVLAAVAAGVPQIGGAPARLTDRTFLGALVEGTFMNPAHHGAHNPAWVMPPSLGVLEKLLQPGSLRLLNVAPEASSDALAVICRATQRGIVVGAGHARPHAERMRQAVDAGLRYVIHLGNGPTGSSLKAFHDGGMLEECLRNDRLIISVIADGVHVHETLLRDWIARKDVSRVIGTSDAGFALTPPEGPFEVFGIRGEPVEGGRYLRVAPSEGAPAPAEGSSDAAPLFGSAIYQDRVFEVLLGLLTREMAGIYHRHHAALPLDEAVWAASEMCAGNAARLLGLEDRGAVRPGARADLLLARISGPPGRHSVSVEGVWVGA